MKYVVKLPMIDRLIFKIGPFAFGYSNMKCKMIAKIHILMSYFLHISSIMLNYCECLCGGCAHSRIEFDIRSNHVHPFNTRRISVNVLWIAQHDSNKRSWILRIIQRHLHTSIASFASHNKSSLWLRVCVHCYRFTVKLLPPWKCARTQRHGCGWALYIYHHHHLRQNRFQWPLLLLLSGEGGAGGG